MFRLIAMIILMEITLSQSAMSEILSPNGYVHFYGAVVSGSCSIDTQSLDQSVIMGQVPASTFSAPGSWAEPIAFWIKLENCDSTVSQTASVAFMGLTDKKDPQVFHAGMGSGSASGVGIGIFDINDKLVIPNTIPLSASAIHDGGNTLFFSARYRTVSLPVNAGDASAAVTFSVIYQ